VRIVAVVIAAGLGLATACGDDDSAKKADPASKVSYPQSTAGLEQLMGDIMGATKAGQARADVLLRSLQLPDSKSWFREHFGDELGTTLAAGYQQVASNTTQMSALFERLIATDRIRIDVERFDGPKDDAAVGYQHKALERMKDRVPLYSVRFVKVGESHGFHLWSFAYVAGSFRWVGMMKRVYDDPPSGKVDTRLLRVRDVAGADKGG
jgi:hypothetical protein